MKYLSSTAAKNVSGDLRAEISHTYDTTLIKRLTKNQHVKKIEIFDISLGGQ